MQGYKKFLVAGVSACAVLLGGAAFVGQQAAAADLYEPPVALPAAWQGFYAGVHVGMGHSGTATGTGFIDDFSLSKGFPIDSGIIGGVQAGYNFQNDRMVYGIEADFSGADLSSERGALIDLGIIGEVGTFTTDVNWFGTVRGRIGVLLDENFLFYGTGGLAYGDVESSIGYRLGICGFCIEDSVSGSDVRVGWTAGAGVEAVLNENMKVKLEYLYVDLGSSGFFNDTFTIFRSDIDIGASSDVNFHVARVGLNIDFDTPIFGQ